MYEARGAEFIRIHEFSAIEFFFRLQINQLGTRVPRFSIEKRNFIVSMVNHATSAIQFHD